MFIAGIIIFLAKILFQVYLVQKQKEITKEMRKLELERKSDKNFNEILEEDFIWGLEERKKWILKEFSDQLYSYHLSRENVSAIFSKL